MMVGPSEIRVRLKGLINKKLLLAIQEYEKTSEQGESISNEPVIPSGSTNLDIDEGNENETEKSTLLIAAEKWLKDKGIEDIEDHKNQTLIEQYLEAMKEKDKHNKKSEKVHLTQNEQVAKTPNYQYIGK
jgi:hypothetical protein